jgi:hypothetical protein
MKALTFETLILGLLCLSVAGLSGGWYHQYQRVSELQRTSAQDLQNLHALQRDARTQQASQEKLQDTLNNLLHSVDAGLQQAHTRDPELDQWAEAVQELREGLHARAFAADMTVVRARLEHAEQQLLGLKTQSPSSTPRPSQPRHPPRPKPIPVLPPFSVLGLESRGGEQFLAVAPHNSRALADVRLLHRGEQLGHWRLKTLTAHSAIFAVAAQPDQAVQLP